jgi:hypothetical protein
VQTPQARALGGEQAGEFGCFVQAGDVDGCDQGEVQEWALVLEADQGVEAEEGAVVLADCYGRAREQGVDCFAVPFLADEQAVDVALVLAGLDSRC